MAIVQEKISETLIKTYSDKGVYIHGGSPEEDYDVAIDPIDLYREYTETETPVIGWKDPNEATVEDYQTALEGLGVNLDG